MLKVAGACGVAGPLVALSFVALAISRSPWFSWTGNALSDLGVGGSATIFNSGLIIGGLLLCAFALGLREVLRGRVLGHVGAVVLFFGSIALCCVGIFSESAGEIHTYVSVAFFLSVPISMFFIGAALVRKREKGMGLFVVVAGVFALAVWALPWPAIAIPEFLSALAFSACSIGLGVWLFKLSKHR
jgi:hypothetical membrane protein